jgi:hypothetical protein
LYALTQQNVIGNLHEILKLFAEFGHITEYAEVRSQIFEEYFMDHRMYLLELYLNAITKIFELDEIPAYEFVDKFMTKYLAMMTREKQYFIDLMGIDNIVKFENFRRENEFDLLSKRVRPWIVGCTDFKDLC